MEKTDIERLFYAFYYVLIRDFFNKLDRLTLGKDLLLDFCGRINRIEDSMAGLLNQDEEEFMALDLTYSKKAKFTALWDDLKLLSLEYLDFEEYAEKNFIQSVKDIHSEMLELERY